MSRAPRRILAIPGSLRRESYNKTLLRAAADAVPDWLGIEVYDELGSVPLFNDDLAETGTPAGVQRLGEAIARSDAVLIATPEYNQAVPGVVKNMIDWLSVGDAPESFEHKPMAVTGVTPGPWGTRLAQTMLRQMLVSAGAVLLPAPTLYLRDAAELFDESGRLVDAKTRDRLVELVVALAEWADALGSPANGGALSGTVVS